MQRVITLDESQLGAGLALCDDSQQASFFNEFCKELAKACETSYNAHKQLAMVADKLTPQAKELLEMLSLKSGVRT
jgi:hypothetical protein